MSKEKNNIYLIEDEESISKLICLYLAKAEISSTPFYNAEDALEALKKEKLPELIILDLNLPGMSGFDFLTEAKKLCGTSMPSVTILSARDEDEDIIKGLGLGADEFITKPFSPGVLVARVQAMLRRQASATIKAEDNIQFADYVLLLNSCVLKKGNTKIPLSTKEYAVLEYLLKNAGTSLTPETIYKAVWNVKYGDITAVAVYIQRLRKKFAELSPEIEFIKTDFGKGYIFNKELLVNKNDN